MTRPITNVIGFDDAPFAREHRGDIRLVGAVCARTRLDGVVSGWVRRDGVNSTDCMIRLVKAGGFVGHIRAILLDGVAVAGFNVVDVHRLHQALSLPVLVVMRRLPDLERIRAALFSRVPGGARKWRLVERAGAIERLGSVWVQRVGLTSAAAQALLDATTLHGNIPEPLRLAHLIAGGIATGRSHGRA